MYAPFWNSYQSHQQEELQMRLPQPMSITLEPCQALALAALRALPDNWPPMFERGLIVDAPVFAEEPCMTGAVIVAVHQPALYLRGAGDLMKLPTEKQAENVDTYKVTLNLKSTPWSAGREQWEIVEVRRMRDDYVLPFVFCWDGRGVMRAVPVETKAA